MEAEQGKEFWRRLFGVRLAATEETHPGQTKEMQTYILERSYVSNLIFGMKAEYLQSVPLVTRLSPAMGFRCAGREKDEPRLRWYSRKRLPTRPSLESRHIVSSNQFVDVS